LHPTAGADEERIFECIPQPVERCRDGVLASVQFFTSESDLPLSKKCIENSQQVKVEMFNIHGMDDIHPNKRFQPQITWG
jgi:hypothetical protein